MSRIERMIATTYDVALTSDSPVYRMGSCAFKNGRLVAGGTNHYHTTHPKSKSATCKLHAETHMVIKARSSLEGTYVCVLRVNNEGQVKHSTPCVDCARLLKSVGVKKVLYVDSNNDLIFEKIDDLLSKDLKSYEHNHWRSNANRN